MTTAKRRRAFLDPTAEQELNTFAQQFFPSNQRQDILDEIASTGTISAASLAKMRANPADSQFITSEVNRITGGKPTGQAKLKEILNLDKPIHEENLTDEELQNRQQQFQALGEAPGETTTGGFENQVNNMAAQIKGAFLSQGIAISDKTLQEASKYAIDALNKGNYDPQQVANIVVSREKEGHQAPSGLFGGHEEGDVLRTAKSIGQDIPKVYTTQVQSGKFVDTSTPVYNASEDLSRIGDILSTRATKTSNEGKVTDYLNTLPDVLSTSRNEFGDVLKEQGQQQLEAATPQLLAGANARGALFSGDVGDILSTTAGGIQGNIESIQAQLEAEDNQFYFNAAYRNALRKQLEGQTDYGAFLAGERARISGEQTTRFNRSQDILTADANADLVTRRNNNALLRQQADLQRQTDLLKSQRTENLIGDIGASAGQIVAAKVGGSGQKTQPGTVGKTG